MESTMNLTGEFPVKFAMQLLDKANGRLQEEQLNKVREILTYLCEDCIAYYGRGDMVKACKFAEFMDIHIGWKGNDLCIETRKLLYEFMNELYNTM